MRYVIPSRNWTFALADAIDSSVDGDVIVVNSDAKKELGEDAKYRMCPDKNIKIEIEADQVIE